MESNSISVAAALESSGAGLRLGLAYHTQTHHMLRCRVGMRVKARLVISC